MTRMKRSKDGVAFPPIIKGEPRTELPKFARCVRHETSSPLQRDASRHFFPRIDCVRPAKKHLPPQPGGFCHRRPQAKEEWPFPSSLPMKTSLGALEMPACEPGFNSQARYAKQFLRRRPRCPCLPGPTRRARLRLARATREDFACHRSAGKPFRRGPPPDTNGPPRDQFNLLLPTCSLILSCMTRMWRHLHSERLLKY